ncbi:hypothetical protein [Mangrovibacter phragmitis]|uniref:hypothetical protein n=1 Tax=Mangrovibacter phragmitis TaxID=1691903 RepID=UPI00336A6C0C
MHSARTQRARFVSRHLSFPVRKCATVYRARLRRGTFIVLHSDSNTRVVEGVQQGGAVFGYGQFPGLFCPLSSEACIFSSQFTFTI